MWHRGTPNRSDYRRTNIALIYNRDWYGSGYQIQILKEDYDKLPQRSRQLLRTEKIGYPEECHGNGNIQRIRIK